jgi:hypothetical protein
MMNCTVVYEDAHWNVGGEESVNNMPVVIARWSLRELVR